VAIKVGRKGGWNEIEATRKRREEVGSKKRQKVKRGGGGGKGKGVRTGGEGRVRRVFFFERNRPNFV